jgi:hypothetical protein
MNITINASRRRLVIVAAMLTAACGGTTELPRAGGLHPAGGTAEPPLLFKGAVIEPSGFATILHAPSPPYPDTPPPPENRPTNEAE